MTFLGHIISSEGVEVDPRKTVAEKNWPRPLTPINIRSLLGFTGCYQMLVDGFASIVSPLTMLNQKCKKFEWSEKCDKSFQLLKDRLTSAPMLTLPEGTKHFVVYYDASRLGLGFFLCKTGK